VTTPLRNPVPNTVLNQNTEIDNINKILNNINQEINILSHQVTKTLPTLCPSCEHELEVRQLACTRCETEIHGQFALPAVLRLGREQQQFISDFVLANGSLKALAKTLGVSYPTVRSRLNDVIENLQSVQSNPEGD